MKVANKVKGLFCGSIDGWKMVLTFSREVLGEVGIKFGVFHKDVLYPLLFVLAIYPPNYFVKERERKWGIGLRSNRGC